MPSVEVTLSSSYASQKSLACSGNARLIHKRAVFASALQLAAQASAVKQSIISTTTVATVSDCSSVKKPVSGVATVNRSSLKTALAPSQKVNTDKQIIVSPLKIVRSSSQQMDNGKVAVVSSSKVTPSLFRQMYSGKSVLTTPSKLNGVKRVLTSSRTPSGQVSVTVTGEKPTEMRKRSRENEDTPIENHILSIPPMKRGVLTPKSSNSTPIKLTSVPKVRPINLRKRTVISGSVATAGGGGKRSSPSTVPPSCETSTNSDWFDNKENILPFLLELAEIFGPEAVQANKLNIIAAMKKSLPLHPEGLSRIPLQDITRLFFNHKRV